MPTTSIKKEAGLVVSFFLKASDYNQFPFMIDREVAKNVEKFGGQIQSVSPTVFHDNAMHVALVTLVLTGAKAQPPATNPDIEALLRDPASITDAMQELSKLSGGITGIDPAALTPESVLTDVRHESITIPLDKTKPMLIKQRYPLIEVEFGEGASVQKDRIFAGVFAVRPGDKLDPSDTEYPPKPQLVDVRLLDKFGDLFVFEELLGEKYGAVKASVP